MVSQFPCPPSPPPPPKSQKLKSTNLGLPELGSTLKVFAPFARLYFRTWSSAFLLNFGVPLKNQPPKHGLFMSPPKKAATIPSPKAAAPRAAPAREDFRPKTRRPPPRSPCAASAPGRGSWPCPSPRLAGVWRRGAFFSARRGTAGNSAWNCAFCWWEEGDSSLGPGINPRKHRPTCHGLILRQINHSGFELMTPYKSTSFLMGGVLLPGLSRESDHFWRGTPPINKQVVINFEKTGTKNHHISHYAA